MKWLKSLFDNNRVILIPIWIFIAKELELAFQLAGWTFSSLSENDNSFLSNYIQWFGVLYGILLPLILVRVWEQLDTIDQEFDREADTVRILYMDLRYVSKLPGDIGNTGRVIIDQLGCYIKYVCKNYPKEVKGKDDNKAIINGNKIIDEIKEKAYSLMGIETELMLLPDYFVESLFGNLNKLIENRENRISHASQTLFENFRDVALVTSIIFLVPFYFVGPIYISVSIGFPYFYVLDTALTVGITFLVIYIYMIIDDLDGPFDGPKQISDKAWKQLIEMIDNDQKRYEQDLLETVVAISSQEKASRQSRKKNKK